jgi:hypothetical protein
LKKHLTLEPEANDQCPVDELLKYKSSEGIVITNSYDFEETEGERSPTFKITEPSKQEFNVRTGGSTSFRTSGLVQATITVCGQETIEPKDDETETIELK